MKKIIAWILLLIVLAGGVYWINKLSYKASPLVQDSINSTDSWKTYKDEVYGFEIKYPTNWVYEENILTLNGVDQIFCPPELTIQYKGPEKALGCERKETYGHMPDTLAPILFFQRSADESASKNPASKILGIKDGFRYTLYLGNPTFIKEYETMASTFKFVSPTPISSKKLMEVTIQVPENINLYSSEMNKYLFDGKPDPSKTWKFIPKKVMVNASTDIMKSSAQAAAEQIDSQGGIPSAEVVYLKIIDKTAYIVLAMDIDGWLTVYATRAKVRPFVEHTLLQFPEVGSVVFGVAPGDNMDQIIKSYTRSSSLKVISPNGGEKLKMGQPYDIKLMDIRDISNVSIFAVQQAYEPLYTKIVENISIRSTDGVFTYRWDGKNITIPASYVIQVCKTEAGVTICDSSDNYFTITN